MMKLLLVSEQAGQRIEIIEDLPDGFYVLRYTDVEGGKTTHDFLQDNLNAAKQCAQDEFGVAEDDWRKAPSS